MASHAPITGAQRRAPNIPTTIVPAPHTRDTPHAVPDAPHLHLRVAPPRINRGFSVLAGRTTIAGMGQRAPVAPRLRVPAPPEGRAASVVARLQKDGLGEVSTAGDQPDLLLQRFELLDDGNRNELLDEARRLIEGQENAKLPPLTPRQERINRLIEIADTTVMRLGSMPAGDTIDRRVTHGIFNKVVADLSAFGITYFGASGEAHVGRSSRPGGSNLDGGHHHGC